MISRKELMDWLGTCPDHRWDIVHEHEDEGHMSVLFVFDEEQEQEEDEDQHEEIQHDYA